MRAVAEHQPDSEYAYATDAHRLRLVLKVERGGKWKEIGVLWNNKYEFAKRRRYTRMRYICRDGIDDYYVCELESEDVRYAYIFLLTERSGEEYYYSEEGLTREYDFQHGYYTFFQYPYINEADIVKGPEWVKGGVAYQIFIDRFRCGDSGKDKSYITQGWGELPCAGTYAGGDLKGITEELGYLKELGFNVIYLTPVFSSPSNHKYNIRDYREVDPTFGGREALDELIETAHGMGMRIILDAVFNHCDESHAYFADVKAKGRRSEYYEYFIVHGDRPEVNVQGSGCNYEIFADCTYMPKWNTSNPKVREYLLGLAEEYVSWGFDGLRLDVADEVSHTFWRELRVRLKEKAPEVLLIGEVWHESGMYLRGDEFDGVMNYKLQKIYTDYFGRGTIGAEEASERINNVVMKHRQATNGMMLNFLDNHDTPRYMEECGGEESRFYAGLAALYFSVGLPCIFYGTETGLRGGGDPDCRRTYEWGKEAKYGGYIKRLKALREELPEGEFYACAEKGGLVLVRENEKEVVKAYFGNKCEEAGETLFEAEKVKVVKERK